MFWEMDGLSVGQKDYLGSWKSVFIFLWEKFWVKTELRRMPGFLQSISATLLNVWYANVWFVTSEYTQSGDCRFLAYIPSWWKNQPWLVRVGGARPPPFNLLPSRTKLQCTLLLCGLIHSPCFISTNTVYVPHSLFVSYGFAGFRIGKLSRLQEQSCGVDPPGSARGN